MTLRWILLAISLLLAWLTWRLIELPVQQKLFAQLPERTRLRKIIGVTISLLILLGAGGLAVDHLKGYEKRLGRGVSAAMDMGDERFFDYIDAMKLNAKICDSYRPPFDGICNSNADHMKFALFGDSHAGQYVPGLLNASTSKDGWLFLGHPACPPTTHINVIEGGEDRKCEVFNKTVLKILAEQKTIKTVVLASLGTPYFKGYDKPSAYNRDGNMKIISDTRKGSLPDMYYQGMSSMIATLRAMGKQVVLIVDDPEMPFEIKACIGGRPLQGVVSKEEKICDVSRAEYERRSQDYRKVITQLKVDYPDMLVFDPANLFCDDKACLPWHNSRSFYRDSDHFSAYGSRYVGHIFLKWLSEHGVAITSDALLDNAWEE